MIAPLEDPGGAGAGDIAEGGGSSGIAGPWVAEVGVIQDIEGLKAKIEIEALMDGEDAGDLRIDLIRRNTPELISGGVSESAGRHGIGTRICRIRYIAERVWVQA